MLWKILEGESYRADSDYPNNFTKVCLKYDFEKRIRGYRRRQNVQSATALIARPRTGSQHIGQALIRRGRRIYCNDVQTRKQGTTSYLHSTLEVDYLHKPTSWRKVKHCGAGWECMNNRLMWYTAHTVKQNDESQQNFKVLKVFVRPDVRYIAFHLA